MFIWKEGVAKLGEKSKSHKKNGNGNIIGDVGVTDLIKCRLKLWFYLWFSSDDKLQRSSFGGFP